MGKKLLAACAIAAAMALALILVCVLIPMTMPEYPDSLGNAHDEAQKITGEYLVATAAAQESTITIFGSSELKTTDICTHPANFFADQRSGFQVNLVGRGSCQSLVHAMSIAASGDSLKGQKVVLITAPQSYVEEGIASDLFLANFSEQQTLSMLSDPAIPDEIKTYLSARIQTLIDAYNGENGTSLQRYTAAGLLTEAVAEENGLMCALLKPYAAASQVLLETRDLVASARVMGSYDSVTPAPDETIDWAAEEAAAVEQAQEMATNNEFFMQDGYYSTYIGRKLAQQEGKDKDLSYAESPEYDDLRCLLELCRIKELDVLFVHVPMHGQWNDYTGFSAEKRAEYYENVRSIVSEYDVQLLDLTGYEYEPYFLCDTMHLGWKGWLEVDKALVEFYAKD